MTVSPEFSIIDTRTLKELRITSYHGFKKKDLMRLLASQIKNQNLDNANYWCAESLMSGYTIDVYDKLIEFYFTEINIKNPLLLTFLWNNFERYTDIINAHTELLDTRNHLELRNILATTVSIMTLSNQFQLPTCIKVAPTDLCKINPRFVVFGYNFESIREFFRPDDPQEMLIPLNEILNHLRSPRNNSLEQVLYWLSWIIAYETEFIKKNEMGPCAERENIRVDKLYWKDCMWILWNIIFSVSQYMSCQNPYFKEVIERSYKFYEYYYNKKNRYKKISIVIYTLILFIKPADFGYLYGNRENYSKIILACANCNSLYKHMSKLS